MNEFAPNASRRLRSLTLSSLALLACAAPVACSSAPGGTVSSPSNETTATNGGGSNGNGENGSTSLGNPATGSHPTLPKTPWNGTAPKGSVPVTGGTLLVLNDGVTAVAADPDRDMVSIVDLPSHAVLGQVQLPNGSEPGRLVEDASDMVHVILRRGGGIADIDVFSHTLSGLRQACALPRGIAFDSGANTLLVSCMTGQLITFDADSTKTAPISSVWVHDSSGTVTDLRDVLVSGENVFVTTFRSATVLQVASDGSLVGAPRMLNTRVDPSAAELAANGLPGGVAQNYDPAVAWRAIVGPAGDIIVVHQAGTDRVINIAADDDGATQVPTSTQCSSSEYGGESCTTVEGAPICQPPLLIGAVSSISPAGLVFDGPNLPQAALPVDITASKDGSSYTVVLAGNPDGLTSAGTPANNVVTVPAVNLSTTPKASVTRFDSNDLCGLAFATSGQSVPGDAVAVSSDGQGQTVVQTRQPAALQYLTASGVVSIPLSSENIDNTGPKLFHTNTGHGMACAGCHAEGGDDGRTWKFTDGFDMSGAPVLVQYRRTQTFRQGFLQTAPFHWNGQFSDMPALVNDVFVHRMAASSVPDTADQEALENWMNGIPPKMHDAPSTEEAAAIAAGKEIFDSKETGCDTCHGGENSTDNLNHDIGFGISLQTPTLKDLAFRAPYLHDGSATNLMARFTDATAMSGKHGNTKQLSAAQLSQLIAYLQSL